MTYMPNSAEKVAARWPYKIINFFPLAFQIKILLWKSQPPPDTSDQWMADLLKHCRKTFIILPDDLSSLLLSMPLIYSLSGAQPRMRIVLLCKQDHKELVSGLFDPRSVLPYNAENLFYGEPHLKEIREKLREFQPDLVLSLLESSRLIFAYLQHVSQAKLRIDLLGESESPFGNIHFSASEPYNRLKHYCSVAGLWKLCGLELPIKKLPIKVSPGTLKTTQSQLAQYGLKSGRYVLFLWQGEEEEAQKAWVQSLDEWLKTQHPGCRLVVLMPDKHPGSNVTWFFQKKIPVFSTGSFSQILGLMECSAGMHGYSGWCLQLGAFTDKPILGAFLEEDRLWDSSWLHSTLQPFYLESRREAYAIGFDAWKWTPPKS